MPDVSCLLEYICLVCGYTYELCFLVSMAVDCDPHSSADCVSKQLIVVFSYSEMISSIVQVSFYRQQYAKVIADKHEQSIAKFGAILAQGIIDAGM